LSVKRSLFVSLFLSLQSGLFLSHPGPISVSLTRLAPSTSSATRFVPAPSFSLVSVGLSSSFSLASVSGPTPLQTVFA
ncbi:hypothetical protein EBZ37_08660, partial [bacterium]|nr:hypothetical protein [bacterium]